MRTTTPARHRLQHLADSDAGSGNLGFDTFPHRMWDGLAPWPTTRPTRGERDLKPDEREAGIAYLHEHGGDALSDEEIEPITATPAQGQRITDDAPALLRPRRRHPLARVPAHETSPQQHRGQIREILAARWCAIQDEWDDTSGASAAYAGAA